MAEWAVTNDMVYHQDKVKRMHVGPQNPELPYYLNGQEIQMVEEEKDIGFWVTKDLTPAIHVRKARGRAMGELNRIRRNFKFMNKQMFCTLYNQRIRPHIDHGMLACPPGNMAEKRLLEQVQDKATAMVWGMRHENAERRRQMLGLMTLDQRRERGDLIEVYKILEGHTRIDPAVFWEVREARNGKRLVKEFVTNGRRA